MLKTSGNKTFGAILAALSAIAFIGGASASTGNLFSSLVKLADSGNAEAQYHVGMMHNNGIGVDKDPAKAFERFQKATALGDPLAAYKVGCYYAGQFAGVVPMDPEKALRHKLIAARAGYSLAQYDVGINYYQEGRYDEAMRWWQRAADQGYPRALYNLSLAYKDGKTVQRDNALAYAYFKLAKLISERKINEKAEETLAEMQKTLSSTELEKAEQIVVSWKSEPTALTRKAAGGLREAQRLARDGK